MGPDNIRVGKEEVYIKYNDNVSRNINNINSLKNNMSIDDIYTFYVDDDGISGEIGDFYDYTDTLDITGSMSKDVRMIPYIELDSPYYDHILELMYHAENPMPPSIGNNTLVNYGEYPNNPYAPYPQRIWLNPEQAYQCCVAPEICLEAGQVFVDSTNIKMLREGFTTPFFEIVEDSIDANIWLNYTDPGGSHWVPDWEEIGGEWYYLGGTLRLINSGTTLQGYYPSYCHEGTRMLGFRGYSLDPNHIIHVGSGSATDYSPTDIDLIEIHVLQDNWKKTGPYYFDRFLEE